MVIINQVILCGFVANINFIFFNGGRWNHVILCGRLTNFDIIFIVVSINHIILYGIIVNIDVYYIFNLWFETKLFYVIL